MENSKIKIFHYGGLYPSVPQKNYLRERNQLKVFDHILLKLGFTYSNLTTVPSQYNVNNEWGIKWGKKFWIAPTQFPSLENYDLVIINDSSRSCIDFPVLRNFIEDGIKEKGKTLIIIAGYGLGETYNSELKSYLGGEVGKRFPKDKPKGHKKQCNCEDCQWVNRMRESIELEDGPGRGLKFRGFVIFKPYDVKEVLWNFKVKNTSLHSREPAFIIHNIGKGKLIIFTSCCHKDWGKYAMGQKAFMDVWRELFNIIYSSSVHIR
jgi:hypothetical protein